MVQEYSKLAHSPNLVLDSTEEANLAMPKYNEDKHKNCVMSLSDIGIDAAVRFIKNREGLWFSEIDVVKAVTGKENKQASQILERLPESIRDEVSLNSITHKFKGPGQKETILITVEGTLKLIMAITGQQSQSLRMKIVEEMTKKFKELGETEYIHTLLQESLATHVAKQAEPQTPETKYIYATESEAFPGLLKIGRTSNIAKRIPNLNTATAPKPHKLVTMAPTLNDKRDEKLAHQYFASKRMSGEFFNVSAEEVMNFFHSHIIPLYNIEMAMNVSKEEEEEESTDKSVLGKRQSFQGKDYY